jgi:hypothetical protein
MENQETEQPTEQQSTQPELTVSDLTNIRSIIDVAVRRGAFGASELTAVGATFDKLNAFVNAVAPAAEKTPKE